VKVGVLGTGVVGQTIGSKLTELGHDVMMGSRRAGNENAVAWVAEAGGKASEGDFSDAAAHGELLFNCTAGEHSLEALAAAGAENIAGKTLIDVSNALDFSNGPPPVCGVSATDSVAQSIQRTYPEARVVKTLNTVNADVMVNPAEVPGEHVMPVCGHDEAKPGVIELLGEFGWPEDRVIDLGDISRAPGMEMYVNLWVAFWGALGSSRFNIALCR
jgi:8-hydroxy-5-deazaflavin:NADPH oxidoreductase